MISVSFDPETLRGIIREERKVRAEEADLVKMNELPHLLIIFSYQISQSDGITW